MSNTTQPKVVLNPAQVRRNRATRKFGECQVRKALNLESVAEVRQPVWRSEPGVQGNALTADLTPEDN